MLIAFSCFKLLPSVWRSPLLFEFSLCEFLLPLRKRVVVTYAMFYMFFFGVCAIHETLWYSKKRVSHLIIRNCFSFFNFIGRDRCWLLTRFLTRFHSLHTFYGAYYLVSWRDRIFPSLVCIPFFQFQCDARYYYRRWSRFYSTADILCFSFLQPIGNRLWRLIRLEKPLLLSSRWACHLEAVVGVDKQLIGPSGDCFS